MFGLDQVVDCRGWHIVDASGPCRAVGTSRAYKRGKKKKRASCLIFVCALYVYRFFMNPFFSLGASERDRVPPLLKMIIKVTGPNSCPTV